MQIMSSVHAWMPIYKVDVDTSTMQHIDSYPHFRKDNNLKCVWTEYIKEQNSKFNLYRNDRTGEIIPIKVFPVQWNIYKMVNERWIMCGASFSFDAKSAIKDIFPNNPIRTIKEAGGNIFLLDSPSYSLLLKVEYAEEDTKNYYTGSLRLPA